MTCLELWSSFVWIAVPMSSVTGLCLSRNGTRSRKVKCQWQLFNSTGWQGRGTVMICANTSIDSVVNVCTVVVWHWANPVWPSVCLCTYTEWNVSIYFNYSHFILFQCFTISNKCGYFVRSLLGEHIGHFADRRVSAVERWTADCTCSQARFIVIDYYYYYYYHQNCKILKWHSPKMLQVHCTKEYHKSAVISYVNCSHAHVFCITSLTYEIHI